MIRSMTAFARQSGATDWGEVTCELRSVNHRYLEIAPRVSEELRYLEPRVRDLISGRLKRGRVDCTLRLQSQNSSTQQAEVDLNAVDRLAGLAAAVDARHPGLAPLRVIDVLRWPGVLQTPVLDEDILGRHALEIVARTLDELLATREREGGRLQQILRERLDAMAQLVDELKRDLPSLFAQFRERLLSRLKEVRDELDPSRLEQEIVLFMQKADVMEEVDRLAVHVKEVREVLDQDNPVGRRLDFLMQELNREANTLGAKSASPELTQASVQLKVLVDQMREQVQNIE